MVSILLAGIISFFLPSNENQRAEQVTISKNHSLISPKVILSWLYDTNVATNLPSKLEGFFVKDINQLLILDLPNYRHDTAPEDRIVLKTPNYWEVVHSIESKQGEVRFRPRNKEKSCVNTNAPCGHYQISAQALNDIGCTTK